MMGYGYGMGIGAWIAMVIFWVGLIVLVVWALSRVSSGGGDSGPRGGSESAGEILDRRFASGEIDEASYRSMHEALRSHRSTRESG